MNFNKGHEACIALVDRLNNIKYGSEKLSNQEKVVYYWMLIVAANLSVQTAPEFLHAYARMTALGDFPDDKSMQIMAERALGVLEAIASEAEKSMPGIFPEDSIVN